ncbi:MAG: hypothetical protein AVDCRST_MAG48-716, partial [uncultured Friedmanniella sp.]
EVDQEDPVHPRRGVLPVLPGSATGGGGRGRPDRLRGVGRRLPGDRHLLHLPRRL